MDVCNSLNAVIRLVFIKQTTFISAEGLSSLYLCHNFVINVFFAGYTSESQFSNQMLEKKLLNFPSNSPAEL